MLVEFFLRVMLIFSVFIFWRQSVSFRMRSEIGCKTDSDCDPEYQCYTYAFNCSKFGCQQRHGIGVCVHPLLPKPGGCPNQLENPYLQVLKLQAESGRPHSNCGTDKDCPTTLKCCAYLARKSCVAANLSLIYPPDCLRRGCGYKKECSLLVGQCSGTGTLCGVVGKCVSKQSHRYLATLMQLGWARKRKFEEEKVLLICPAERPDDCANVVSNRECSRDDDCDAGFLCCEFSCGKKCTLPSGVERSTLKPITTTLGTTTRRLPFSDPCDKTVCPKTWTCKAILPGYAKCFPGKNTKKRDLSSSYNIHIDPCENVTCPDGSECVPFLLGPVACRPTIATTAASKNTQTKLARTGANFCENVECPDSLECVELGDGKVSCQEIKTETVDAFPQCTNVVCPDGWGCFPLHNGKVSCKPLKEKPKISCESFQCPYGYECVDKEGFEVCRPYECSNPRKIGYCPLEFEAMKAGCEDQCERDADCSGLGKCCFTGCRMVCAEPLLTDPKRG